MDNDDETPDFKTADRKTGNLLDRLADKGLCPCCVARALMFHAASLAEYSVGSAEAIEMFESIISAMRENNMPAPDPDEPSVTSH
jgi:hypothetical protein